MSTDLQSRPQAPEEQYQTLANQWGSSFALEADFRSRNLELGVSDSQQEAVDTLLQDNCTNLSVELANHQRRVGSYAGRILPIAHPEYDTSSHVGLVRISGGLHDIGKSRIDEGVLGRSLGLPGFGAFSREEDMGEMLRHPEEGYLELTEARDILPLEVSLVAGFHHQFPERGHTPYGMDITDIDKLVEDQELARWIVTASKVISLADYYDASSRNNSYFPSEETRQARVHAHFYHYLGELAPTVLDALDQERTRFLATSHHAGQIAVAA